MTRNLFKIAVMMVFMTAPALISDALAAGMGGSGPPVPCGGPFPPCPIPLDGGVSFLLIAGAAYGGKKIYDSRKKDPA